MIQDIRCGKELCRSEQTSPAETLAELCREARPFRSQVSWLPAYSLARVLPFSDRPLWHRTR